MKGMSCGQVKTLPQLRQKLEATNGFRARL